jgi:hypothetical protein
MSDGDIVPAHERVETITEVVEYPAHEERAESPAYRHARHILIDRLDLPCRICGSREQRETHHIFEWAEWGNMDPAKVLTALRQIDFYGFGHEKGDEPVATPDDIRNLVVLCRHHHRLPGGGIHNLTGPIWMAQLGEKAGVEVVKPEAG